MRQLPHRTCLGTWSRLPALFGALVLVTATAALNGAQASASSTGGGRSRIAALEQQIAADGAAAKRLVVSYDAAEAREVAVRRRLVAIGHELVARRAIEAETGRELREIAVEAYVDADSGGGYAVSLSVPSDLSSVAAVYTGVATGRLSSIVTAYESEEYGVRVEQAALRREQVAVEAALRQLLPDRNAAEAAVAKDEALLRTLRGSLRRALVVDLANDAAADAAAEKALAEQPIAVPAASLDTAPAPAAARSSGPSGYVNPLRGVSELSPERIDQGVDYSAFGPIYAIGYGTVLSTVNGGWPGGTYITYRLASGPATGLVVYAAEDIEPLVHVGENVTPETVLGTVYEGPDGIETGWADNGTGDTMARDAGQFYGWNSTAFGANFSQLLVSLGAPGGIPQNNPATGVVPSDWPTW
ncbi:MAG: hypothetical protein ABSC73_07950 [Acidimicrobiales bacterium]